MEVGGREVQSPSKDSIEMILLTCFNLKENCDNFIFKEVCANSKNTHTAFASTVAVTFGYAWP